MTKTLVHSTQKPVFSERTAGADMPQWRCKSYIATLYTHYHDEH